MLGRVLDLMEDLYIISKVPPGPPPRPGLDWKEKTHRWIRPEDRERFEGKPRELEYDIEFPVVSRQIKDIDKITVDMLLQISNRVHWQFDAEDQPSYVNTKDTQFLSLYQGGAGAEMNRTLRKREPLVGDDLMMAQEIQGAMKPITFTQSLYRGIPGDVKSDWQEGQSYSIDSFMSTSRDPKVAYNFIMDNMPEEESEIYGTFMEVYATPTAYGMTWSNSDDIHEFDESETLLDIGQDFTVMETKVIGVVGPGGIERKFRFIKGYVD